MKIIIATNNEHKVKEIKNILKCERIKILSLEDIKNKTVAAGIRACKTVAAGFSLRVKENGKTYFENALKKAKAVSRLVSLPVLADDSGLEIEFLKNAPGIYSSRFLCRDRSRPVPTFREKNLHILKMMEKVPFKKRRAKFVCSCVLITPEGKTYKTEGECKGFIHAKIAGKNGFGYDPIFYIPRFKKTMAQLPEKTKNKISHRAKAFLKMKKNLAAFLS